MKQTRIVDLELRQKLLESEITEALLHAPANDPMIADLKSRALYVRHEIERLRKEAADWLH